MPHCQFLFIMSMYSRKGPKTKVLGKIQKNYRNSISPEDSGSQKDKSRGGPQPPHAPWARLGLGRAQGWCRHLGRLLAMPFGLYIALDLNIEGGSTIFRETHPRSAAAISIPGIRSSVLAPCRDGDSEEIITIVITTASPSTINDSSIHV